MLDTESPYLVSPNSCTEFLEPVTGQRMGKVNKALHLSPLSHFLLPFLEKQ